MPAFALPNGAALTRRLGLTTLRESWIQAAYGGAWRLEHLFAEVVDE
jgi:hypothetical protein